MAFVSTLFVCAALASASAAEVQVQKPSRAIAIAYLRPLGAEPEVVTSLSRFLRAELQTLDTVRLLDEAQTEACLLAAVKNNDGCGENRRCWMKAASSCKVELLLTGTVATLGDAHVLDLKLVDGNTGREVARDSQKLVGDQSLTINGVRALATRMVAPEQYFGSIEVRLDRPGAHIFVDGVEVGVTPIAALKNITPGTHGLKIVLEGYQDFDRFVDVQFARKTIVGVTLSGTALAAQIEAVDENGEVLAPVPVPMASGAISRQAGYGPLLLGGFGLGVLGGSLCSGGIAILATMQSTMAPYVRDEGGYKVVDDREAYATRMEDFSWWPLGWVFTGVGTAVLAASFGLVGYELVSANMQSQESEEKQ